MNNSEMYYSRDYSEKSKGQKKPIELRPGFSVFDRICLKILTFDYVF